MEGASDPQVFESPVQAVQETIQIWHHYLNMVQKMSTEFD